MLYLYMVKSVIKSIDSEDAASGREAALLFANEQLQNNVSQLSGTVTRQERMIEMLQKALFGQKSEKITRSGLPGASWRYIQLSFSSKAFQKPKIFIAAMIF